MTEPRITNKYLDKLLSSDFRLYYHTREFNSALYLHYKGFKKIENLEEFTGLKILHLEGNAISLIEGLDSCVELKSLYLQENCICEIQGLDFLENLTTLDLSDNMIEQITGLKSLSKLSTLTLQRNCLVDASGLAELLEVLSISVLDLSHNSIADPEVVPNVLEKLPNLNVLYLMGNPVCKTFSSYRRTLIRMLKALTFLDDSPIHDIDRRFIEAYFNGGIDAERTERRKWAMEKEEERIRKHDDFRLMVEEALKERNSNR